MAYLTIYVIFWFGSCIGLQNAAAEIKKSEIFTAIDKTKWIQLAQFEQIFSSIEDNLREANEKQNRDNLLLTQLSNHIQSINIRLQSMEEQLTRIDRAESYNKAKLQQFSDGSIKEEVQIERITQRLEKNQMQLIQRLDDVDSNLETISRNQNIMEKEVRKINVAQNALTDNVDELSQHTKQQSTKFLQNITNTQQELNLKFKHAIKFSPASNQEEKLVRIITSEDIGKNNTNQSRSSQNDDSQMELLSSLSNIENKLDEIKNHVQSLETSLQENNEVTNKIYNKLDSKNEEFEESFKDQFTILLERIKQQNNRDLAELDGKFRKNFESIIFEQVSFKNTCRWLQVHEEQMVDKAVEILEKLFDYVDNRTYEIQHELENLSQHCDETKRVAKYPPLNGDNKVLMNLENKTVKPLQNVANATPKETPVPKPALNTGTPKPNLSDNLDGTNVQDIKPGHPKTVTPTSRELLPNDEAETFVFSDESRIRPTSVEEKEDITNAAESARFASEFVPLPKNYPWR